MEQGLDYSWGRPNLAAVVAAGYKFVIRYLATQGGGKEITAPEAVQIRAAGLGLVLVFEQYAQRAKEGFGAGQADGATALAQARSVGFPDDRPIYFAVDWDTTPEDQIAIDAYLKGAAESIGANRVGMYGSFYVVERCKANGSADWFWQTYAWSGGQVSAHNHLMQYLNGQSVGGATVDFDKSSQADFGAWTAAVPVPAPKPPTPPAPAPTAGTYTVQKGDTLSAIASRFGTTYQYLAHINNIANPNIIFPGEVLKINAQAAPAPTYIVVRGDTLSAIAVRFGTTIAHLVALNGIANPNLIYTGQVLKVA